MLAYFWPEKHKFKLKWPYLVVLIKYEYLNTVPDSVFILELLGSGITPPPLIKYPVYFMLLARMQLFSNCIGKADAQM